MGLISHKALSITELKYPQVYGVVTIETSKEVSGHYQIVNVCCAGLPMVLKPGRRIHRTRAATLASSSLTALAGSPERFNASAETPDQPELLFVTKVRHAGVRP
jgi:hypothetical protein